eukprot:Nk52_evm1s1763 gene=Nk52_evmTU1s1763
MISRIVTKRKSFVSSNWFCLALLLSVLFLPSFYWYCTRHPLTGLLTQRNTIGVERSYRTAEGGNPDANKNQKKKIAIAMVNVPGGNNYWDVLKERFINYKWYDGVRESFLNHQKYADKHGYDLLVLTNRITDFGMEHPTFMKVPFLQQIFRTRKYSWVWMVDFDTLVTNRNIRLESLIDDKFDIVMTKDGSGLNAGSMLCKDSDWMMRFLDDVISRRHWGFYEEQSPMKEILNSSEGKKHLKVLPQRSMNSYPPSKNELIGGPSDPEVLDQDFYNRAMWREGDFLIHVVARRSGAWAELLLWMVKNVNEDGKFKVERSKVTRGVGEQ